MKISACASSYILEPLKHIKKAGGFAGICAARSYNKSLRMIADDFSGKRQVPYCNLRFVYDNLLFAYSQMLASRKIEKGAVKYLKRFGVTGMDWAHIARLSDRDKQLFIDGLYFFPKDKLVQMAAFKNNSAKIMSKALESKECKHVLEGIGVNIPEFKKILQTGNSKLFNLDIVENPLRNYIYEAEESIGLGMIRRIILNERSAKMGSPEKLLPCFDKKILSKKYSLPEFPKKYCYYRSNYGLISSPMESYLDAFDRRYVVRLADERIKRINK